MNFDHLPTIAPETPVLDRIADAGHEIASLNDEELVRLANELREFLLYSVSTTGGHFGAGLGVGGVGVWEPGGGWFASRMGDGLRAGWVMVCEPDG